MKNLYIDFDGVILDTIPTIRKMCVEHNIDFNDNPKVYKILSTVDWDLLIKNTPEINDSIKSIKKLRKSKKFNISILTHINSLEEGIAKIRYLEKQLPDITKIIVPKVISKTKMLETKGAILVDDYTNNLDEWSKEGGIAIKFTSRKDKEYEYPTIDKLDQLLDLY